MVQKEQNQPTFSLLEHSLLFGSQWRELFHWQQFSHAGKEIKKGLLKVTGKMSTSTKKKTSSVALPLASRNILD